MSRSAEPKTSVSGFAPERPPQHRYHLLRAALQAGLPGLAKLEGERKKEIVRRADKTFELESLVLDSTESAE